MTFNRKPFFFDVCMWTAVVLSALLAIAIIITALRGDTTLLGDPYYEDQIIAWQRAFAPWAFTWLIIALSVILGMIGRDTSATRTRDVKPPRDANSKKV